MLLFVATAGSAQTTPASKTASSDCAGLLALKVPNVKITSADAIAANPSEKVLSHCKVLGVIETEIRFQMLLPDGWNGRFVMGGNGGFAGSLDGDGPRYVRLGYAHAITDTGHQASAIQASWALHNPERIANWGHRAVHRTAETAKAVISAYYGRQPAFSYFTGCSNGGRQALM